jgi:hypothetical protein
MSTLLDTIVANLKAKYERYGVLEDGSHVLNLAGFTYLARSFVSLEDSTSADALTRYFASAAGISPTSPDLKKSCVGERGWGRRCTSAMPGVVSLHSRPAPAPPRPPSAS